MAAGAHVEQQRHHADALRQQPDQRFKRSRPARRLDQSGDTAPHRIVCPFLFSAFFIRSIPHRGFKTSRARAARSSGVAIIFVTSASTSSPRTGLISMPSFLASAITNGIAHGRVEGAAQQREPLRRHAGRREERARHAEFGEHDLHDLPVLRRPRELDRHRHALEIGMRPHAHLHQDVDQLVPDPLRLGRGERGPVLAGLALHFAVLDREAHFGRAGIAVHHLELGAEQVVAEHRQDVAVRAGRAGAEDGLLRRSRPCSVRMPEACQVTVTNTVCVALPIQPNFVASNSAFLPSGDRVWNSRSNGRPFWTIRISVPSFGARL